MTEKVVYRGITFRRYPDSKRPAHRRYFRPGIADAERGIQALHQEVWKDHHGSIPPGMHVHHADGDWSNNDPGNLCLVTHAEHRRLHAAALADYNGSEQCREHLEAIRPKAAEWHASEEGRRWHVEHGRRSWEGRTVFEVSCEECSTPFFTRHAGVVRFCSELCYSRHRERTGRRLKDKTCPICGKAFRAPARRQTCSYSCGARLRQRNRK